MKIFSGQAQSNTGAMYLQNDNLNPAPQTPKSNREVMIDILRGFAVLVMIITHVIAITYSGGAGTSAVVYYIGLIGGIFSFTTFLFISGMSAYYSTLKPEDDNIFQKGSKTRKRIGRLIKLLLAYYLIATASIFVNTSLYSLPPSSSWIHNVTHTLFFLIIPSFSEFLIPLFLISLSVILFPKFYKYLLKNPLFGLFFMSALYGIGSIISQIDLKNDNLNTLKSLLGGQVFSAGSLHSFPIFQYFPVFLLGIYLGNYYFHHEHSVKRIKVTALLTLVFGVLTLAGTISYTYLQTNLLFPLPDQGRFPPSITFLTLSLCLAIASLLVFQIIFKFLPQFIRNILTYFGANAIEALVIHLLLLFAYQFLTTTDANPNGIKHTHLSDILIIYFVLLFLTALVIGIKNYIKKWTLQEKEFDTVWWFFTERAISSLVLIFIFIFFGVQLYNSFIAPIFDTSSANIVFAKNLVQEQDSWWNHDFSTFRALEVKNNDSAAPMFADSWVSFEFNHQDAIGRGTAIDKDGTDLRVVYFDNTTGVYDIVPFLLDGADTSNAKIAFKLLQNINPGQNDNNYYLYYGNELADKFTEPQDKYSTPPNSNSITVGVENFHAIKGSENQQWFLKGTSQNQKLTFEADIQSDNISDQGLVTYTINNSTITGKMNAIGDKKYQASIDLTDTRIGTYSIQATVIDLQNGLKVNHTQNIVFHVSYPLYVSWTFDWEGWDVSQDNLNAIASVENTYGIKSTHFFNPRIYVKDQSTQNNTIGIISPERAAYLTSWMKDRVQSNGDEVGMHIHMWQDMVKEAGVTPRTGPIIQGTYGSDVPAYVYTQAELEKIFSWGKSELESNGLGDPTSFRIGAWMSGENVLMAEQNTGFIVDSSGRTGGPINASISYSTQLPWTLSDTTYPYIPNANDINRWDASSSNRLSIWEFPDNGADSYWYSTEELIKRFDDNFPTKDAPLSHPQDLVYLTHPHWFTSVDYGKIKSLFSYISQFKYSDDKGPVIFDNLKDVYSQWDVGQFYNGN